MAARQAMKENLQCTSKYGHLRISQDICHVRMTDIEGFLTIYGHSDNLFNNKMSYLQLHAVLTHIYIVTQSQCSFYEYLAINILTTPIKPGRFLQMDQQVVVVCRCWQFP